MKFKFLNYFIIFTFLFVVSTLAFVTGISYTDIVIQNDDKFGDGGKMWIISWSGAGTDEISGFISKETLTQVAKQNLGNAIVNQNFNIKMTSGDEYGLYNFISRGDLRDIYDYDLVFYYSGYKYNQLLDTTKREALDWIRNNCADYDNDGFIEYETKEFSWPITGIPNWVKVWCAKLGEKKASVKGISSPKEIFSTSWEFWADGQQIAQKIITNDANVNSGLTQRLSDNILIKWGGNLKTGYSPPQPIGILGAHSNSFPDGWIIIDEKNYDNYKTYLEGGGFYTCIRNWANNIINKDACESELISKINLALTKSTNQQFFDMTKLDDGRVFILDKTFENGAFKLNLKERVTIPTFVLYIDADYLRIIIPTGIPKIISISSPTFLEGQGRVFATVVNDGNAKGSFEVRISECSQDFTVVSLPQLVELNPGEQRVLELIISGSSQDTTKAKIEGTCVLYFKETTTQKEVSKSFGVSFNQLGECNPNQYIVKVENGLDAIYRCSADGLRYEPIARCDINEYAKAMPDGSYQCVPKEKPVTIVWVIRDKNCISINKDSLKPKEIYYMTEKDCKENLSKGRVKLDLPVTFGALSGLLILSIATLPFFKTKNPAFLMVGAVVGLIVGFGVFIILNNIVKILIGITILGISGGILLWLFGPIFIALAGIIGAIINSLGKGKRKR